MNPQFLEPSPPVISLPAATRPRPAASRASRIALVGALAGLLVLGSAGGASAMPQRPAGPTDTSATGSDAAATVLEGIDVSHWQGTIDWTKVAAAGKKFAIIKATEDANYLDPMYAANHAAAKSLGLWTGAYHFAQPSTAANDAILEADWFAAHANLGAGDLIPALDLEVSGGLSVAGLQKWVTTFLGEVTAKVGMRPMIYTSPSFWRTYMGDTQALADAGYKTLWIAHWGVTSPSVPANNWGGHGWTFWQYTSSGTVPGITGRVDLDRFNGADLTTQAYSAFKLVATIPSGFVKQGASSAANVAILRTNFTSEVALDVSGLPAGASVTFNTNPTTATSAAMTVTTDPNPAATPTGTYPLTITGASSGITRTTTLSLIVADGIPPTLVAPSTRLLAGRTLGSTSVPVRVTWGATDPSGIAASALQRSINGGSWTWTTLPSPAAVVAETTIPNGASLLPRARATDRKGNTSGWLEGRLVRATIYDQTSTTIRWSGTWHTALASSAYRGSTRYASARGASATFAFTGSSVALVAAKGPTRGSVLIYIDGVLVRTVSTYASTNLSRQIVYAANWAGSGSHKIGVVVVGTAGHPRVDIDAFVRLTQG